MCEDAGDDWDEHFLAQDQADTEEPEDQEDDSYDLEPPSPKIKTYKEAVSAIEDIQAFLDFKGHNELSTKLGTHINSVISLQCAHTTVQTTINDFLKFFMHQNTKPLYNSHPCITAIMLFPNGGRYRGVPLYNLYSVRLISGFVTT